MTIRKGIGAGLTMLAVAATLSLAGAGSASAVTVDGPGAQVDVSGGVRLQALDLLRLGVIVGD